MKSSAIRHPKREHNITVYSWMMKVTEKNLYAANLLAYLEGKFNLMLDLENKQGGWMKLHKIQIKNGIFADAWDYYDSAIDTLKALQFISVDEVGTPDMPLKEGEIWVNFHALAINQWLDEHVKNGNKQSPIVDMMPYFAFIPFSSEFKRPEPYKVNVVLPGEITQQPLIDVGEKKKRTRKKDIELDTTFIGAARELFAFWKMKTGHKRSNLQDKYAKMAIDRMKEGYTANQIAHGIIGLTHSKYHIDNKYDHFEYVVRDTNKLDRMCAIATEKQINLDDAAEEYSLFLYKYREGQDIKYEEPQYKNPITGGELK